MSKMPQETREIVRMDCPLCQRLLQPGEQHRFETLAEHVFDPNGTPSLKTGYKCRTSGCPACIFEMAWLEDGEGPYGGVAVMQHTLKWNEDIPCPRGTLHYKVELDLLKETLSTYGMKLGRLRLYIRFHNFDLLWQLRDKGDSRVTRRSGGMRVLYYTVRGKIRDFRRKVREFNLKFYSGGGESGVL